MFLVDFGIAQYLGEIRPDLLLGLGTPGYAAPELYPDSRDSIGPSSDIYSLGALLHYACSGDDPTRRLKPFTFPALSSRIPSELALLIREMLAPQPEARPTLLAVEHVLDAQRRAYV
jgi:serine/threonine protein kinase